MVRLLWGEGVPQSLSGSLLQLKAPRVGVVLPLRGLYTDSADDALCPATASWGLPEIRDHVTPQDFFSILGSQHIEAFPAPLST